PGPRGGPGDGPPRALGLPGAAREGRLLRGVVGDDRRGRDRARAALVGAADDGPFVGRGRTVSFAQTLNPPPCPPPQGGRVLFAPLPPCGGGQGGGSIPFTPDKSG